jgi:shikimate kinase
MGKYGTKGRKKRMNIYLIGFMGCGKSEVGRCLERNFGQKLVEMDETIEKQNGMTISEIFREQGEETFRKMETDFLKKLRFQKKLVVSCGGGVPMRECNVCEMKAGGKIVLLTATPDTVYQRVHKTRNRPLLKDRMTVEGIRELMEERRERYEKAADIRITTDNKTPAEIAEEIMRILEETQ